MELAEVLSSYIEARDNARTNGSIFIGQSTMNRMSDFSRMVNAHHMMLAEILPPLNLAELEALNELIASRLSYVRNIRDHHGK